MIMPSSQLSAPLPAVFDEGWQVVRAADRGLGWHPQVRELLVHWLTLCTMDGHMPSRTAIDRVLPGELLPYTWMLDVQGAPWRFRYRRAGCAFTASIGQDVTHHWYDEIRPRAWAGNRLRLITTAREGMPTWRRGRVPMEEMAFATGGWADIETLMLPLAFDGIDTDTVLGISMPYRPIELWGEAAD